MKKFLFLCFFFSNAICFAKEPLNLKLFGETDYIQKRSKSLITSFDAEYRMNVYEPKHKFWLAYVGGKINPDYDHFGNEIKTNVFTTFGIDF